MRNLILTVSLTLFGQEILMPATPHRVNKPYGLNHGLSYLPWSQLRSGLSNFDLQSVNSQCLSSGGTPNDTIRLTSGMTLRLDQMMIFEQRWTMFVPHIAATEWIMPNGPLSDRDFFFLSLVLSAGEPQTEALPDKDYVVGFRRWLQSMAASQGDGFTQAVSAQLRSRWQSTLGVFIQREGAPKAEPGIAARVREWLSLPSAADLAGGNHPRSWLRIALPVLAPSSNSPTDVVFHAFHSAGAFHMNRVDKGFVPNLQSKNAWYYGAPVYPGRSLLEVRIRIRFSTSMGTHDVPVYWSWTDIERHFGVKILGVRREPAFLACAQSHGFMDPQIPSLTAEDGKVLILLDRLPVSGPAGNHFVQLAAGTPAEDELWKSQLLAAPEDIFIVRSIV